MSPTTTNALVDTPLTNDGGCNRMTELWFPPRSRFSRYSTNILALPQQAASNCHTTQKPTVHVPESNNKNLQYHILPTDLYGSCDRETESALIRDLKTSVWEQHGFELSTQERTGQTARRCLTLRLRMRCANHTKKRGCCPFRFTVFWNVKEEFWYFCPPVTTEEHLRFFCHAPTCLPYWISGSTTTVASAPSNSLSCSPPRTVSLPLRGITTKIRESTTNNADSIHEKVHTEKVSTKNERLSLKNKSLVELLRERDPTATSSSMSDPSAKTTTVMDSSAMDAATLTLMTAATQQRYFGMTTPVLWTRGTAQAPSHSISSPRPTLSQKQQQQQQNVLSVQTSNQLARTSAHNAPQSTIASMYPRTKANSFPSTLDESLFALKSNSTAAPPSTTHVQLTSPTWVGTNSCSTLALTTTNDSQSKASRGENQSSRLAYHYTMSLPWREEKSAIVDGVVNGLDEGDRTNDSTDRAVSWASTPVEHSDNPLVSLEEAAEAVLFSLGSGDEKTDQEDVQNEKEDHLQECSMNVLSPASSWLNLVFAGSGPSDEDSGPSCGGSVDASVSSLEQMISTTGTSTLVGPPTASAAFASQSGSATLPLSPSTVAITPIVPSALDLSETEWDWNIPSYSAPSA